MTLYTLYCPPWFSTDDTYLPALSTVVQYRWHYTALYCPQWFSTDDTIPPYIVHNGSVQMTLYLPALSIMVLYRWHCTSLHCPPWSSTDDTVPHCIVHHGSVQMTLYLPVLSTMVQYRWHLVYSMLYISSCTGHPYMYVDDRDVISGLLWSHLHTHLHVLVTLWPRESTWSQHIYVIWLYIITSFLSWSTKWVIPQNYTDAANWISSKDTTLSLDLCFSVSFV